YAHVPGSFICLRIDTTALESEVRFEPGGPVTGVAAADFTPVVGRRRADGNVPGPGDSSVVVIAGCACCCRPSRAVRARGFEVPGLVVGRDGGAARP
ncbi:unnamed protein product, partial [Ectocarpus sp. 12 AP-2014]